MKENMTRLLTQIFTEKKTLQSLVANSYQNKLNILCILRVLGKNCSRENCQQEQPRGRNLCQNVE